MAGTITSGKISDGSTRYRARYRDAGGRQHEKRFAPKVDARWWLDEATSALVTQTWTAPERVGSRSPVGPSSGWRRRPA